MKEKLNDKELINLFKRCIGGSADSCRACPYQTSPTHCKIEKLHTDVLNLAIRLYCENGKLKTELREECEEHKAFTKKAKKEIERLKIDLENEKNWGKIQTKQAEKDTAKEILGLILAKEFEKGDYLTDDELKELFKERYGVEVE